jgi:hypothetical protein
LKHEGEGKPNVGQRNAGRRLKLIELIDVSGRPPPDTPAFQP